MVRGQRLTTPIREAPAPSSNAEQPIGAATGMCGSKPTWRLTCDAEAFHFTARLTAHDQGELFADRRFTRSIPCHLI